MIYSLIIKKVETSDSLGFIDIQIINTITNRYTIIILFISDMTCRAPVSLLSFRACLWNSEKNEIYQSQFLTNLKCF